MKSLALSLAALLVLAAPAYAGGGLFSRRNHAQRVVVRQQVVVQKVVAVQAQPVIVQPVVAAYSQAIVLPQAVYAAPIVQQQVVPGCAAFFAR